jgi:hypothetical protein
LTTGTSLVAARHADGCRSAKREENRPDVVSAETVPAAPSRVNSLFRTRPKRAVPVRIGAMRRELPVPDDAYRAYKRSLLDDAVSDWTGVYEAWWLASSRFPGLPPDPRTWQAIYDSL